MDAERAGEPHRLRLVEQACVGIHVRDFGYRPGQAERREAAGARGNRDHLRGPIERGLAGCDAERAAVVLAAEGETREASAGASDGNGIEHRGGRFQHGNDFGAALGKQEPGRDHLLGVLHLWEEDGGDRRLRSRLQVLGEVIGSRIDAHHDDGAQRHEAPRRLRQPRACRGLLRRRHRVLQVEQQRVGAAPVRAGEEALVCQRHEQCRAQRCKIDGMHVMKLVGGTGIEPVAPAV